MRGSDRTSGAAFLLVGADQLLRLDDIVAILDERACSAAPTREHIASCRRRGVAHDLTGGEGLKAVVLCRRGLFLSPFSSTTLRRRIASDAVFR